MYTENYITHIDNWIKSAYLETIKTINVNKIVYHCYHNILTQTHTHKHTPHAHTHIHTQTQSRTHKHIHKHTNYAHTYKPTDTHHTRTYAQHIFMQSFIIAIYVLIDMQHISWSYHIFER